MTVFEVLEQAKALDFSERKELMKLLVDTFDQPVATPARSEEHWGKQLVQLLEQTELADWGDSY
ncbi:MAG: hypothetical protein H7Z42_22065, partial [Roseiflexaceae bacterium]|nr:hypothetical protein [Roseiflexaceae bacterium]